MNVTITPKFSTQFATLHCFQAKLSGKKSKMKWAAIALFLFLSGSCFGLSDEDEEFFNREDFPPYFVFGAGTSAYQVEGAVAEGGRSPSIWDIFTHSGRALGKGNGDIAADQYHKYKDDVKLMADIGLDAYRFSISWSRLLPLGRGKINAQGVDYYNNLINELLSQGIKPHVTLHHLDHPQILEEEYGGWLSKKMVEDFTNYADVCFRNFGDRVKSWITINEANIFAIGAYDIGGFAPGRCSYPFGSCPLGNSSTEPYIVGHNILLGHASAYKLYKENYRTKQNGLVGFNIYSYWCEPYSNSTLDSEATQRMLDFYVGWMLDPLVNGDYPTIMKKNAGQRLPSFSRSQSKLLKGSFDFIGLNHYYTIYVGDGSRNSRIHERDFNVDIFATFAFSRDEELGNQTVPIKTIPNNPEGLRRLLLYLKEAYGNPRVYIQENGFGTQYNETLNDTARIGYTKDFINAILSAVRDGANARGYFVWSFLDVYELLTGYSTRYGLCHVDFSSKNLTRKPKLSAYWYTKFLERTSLMLYHDNVIVPKEGSIILKSV